MEGTDTQEVKRHVRIYLLTFGALAVLTVATVAVASVEMAVGMAIFVAMVIATVKGSLVAGNFMHLVSEKKLIYWVLIVTAFLFFAMLFIILFTVNDQVLSASVA